MRVEIADWCHEAKYAADLLQDRGADPEVVLFLRNASKYAAAFKVAQALENRADGASMLDLAQEYLDAMSARPGSSRVLKRDLTYLIHRLAEADGWLSLFTALLIQE